MPHRAVLIWGAVTFAVVVPVLAAATSPYLAWRDPVYIAAGFAGIAAMALMLLQPLLILGRMPGLEGPRGRRLHRRLGGALATLIVVHVAGLWITSPPDVVDSLTFTSPTPFSVWGVLAMWAILLSAALAGFRRRLGPQAWRRLHLPLAAVIVGGTVLHALLVEGAMESVTKAMLAASLLAASLWLLQSRLRRRA